MEGNYPPTTVGWIAILTGIAVILAVILITLMYTTFNGVFGTWNDALNGIVAILSAILAWKLYAAHHAKSPMMSQIALGLAMVGTIVMVIGSVLILFNFTGWVHAGLYTGVGSALIGLWVAVFSYSMLNDDLLPNNLVKFGMITGIIMAFGLFTLPGILAGIDSLEIVPWYLKATTVAGLGIYVTYPIWCIWLGRSLLKLQ